MILILDQRIVSGNSEVAVYIPISWDVHGRYVTRIRQSLTSVVAAAAENVIVAEVPDVLKGM